MIPISTYIFIYGIPIGTIIFSIFLYNVIGKRVFDTSDTEKAKE